MLRRFVLALAILALWASAAWTQTPVPERRVFAVSVLDKEGQAVTGLSAANFRGKFKGQPVNIISVTSDAGRRRIALVIDTGIRSAEQWPLGWTAAESLVLSLGPNHDVALYVLTTRLERYGIFRRDAQRLHRKLLEAHEQAKAQKGPVTHPAKAVPDVLQEFPSPGFADVLYLITGSPHEVSSSDKESVEAALVRAGVRAFTLWINERRGGYQAYNTYYASHNFSASLPEASGGRALDIPPSKTKLDELPYRLQPLYEAIEHVYRVEVEFPRSIDKRRQWTLEVVDAEGKKRKDVQVLYPRLLVPGAE